MSFNITETWQSEFILSVEVPMNFRLLFPTGTCSSLIGDATFTPSDNGRDCTGLVRVVLSVCANE